MKIWLALKFVNCLNSCAYNNSSLHHHSSMCSICIMTSQPSNLSCGMNWLPVPRIAGAQGNCQQSKRSAPELKGREGRCGGEICTDDKEGAVWGGRPLDVWLNHFLMDHNASRQYRFTSLPFVGTALSQHTVRQYRFTSLPFVGTALSQVTSLPFVGTALS